MTIAAQAIIDRAAVVLMDVTNVKYTEAQLLLWISDAQRQIVLLRPDAGATVSTVTLTANQSQQSLPAGGLRLLDVLHNGPANNPGDTISVIPRHIMDQNDRSWPDATAAATIKHVVYDDRFPSYFYTVPQPNGPLEITAAYSVSPTEIASAGTNLGVPDIFESPVLDWVLYRALSRLGQQSGHDPGMGDPGLAAAYHDAFFATMKAKAGVDLGTSPNWSSYPRNPQQPTMSPGA